MQEDAAIEQLSAYLDGELSDVEVAELELRLAHDAGLRAELESLRSAVDLLRTHGPVQAPAALYGDILRAVEDEPMPGGWWAWLQRPFGMPLPTIALAGVALAVVGVTVGGAVVASAPGVLRPAVADLDYDSPYEWSTEASKPEKVAAKDRKQGQNPPVKNDVRGAADADEEAPEPPPPVTAAAGAQTDAVADVGSADAEGTADDLGSLSTTKTKTKKMLDNGDGAYSGSGTMYSGGPVVSVGLKPEDLERVAALYQKFAGTRDSRTNKSAARLANLPNGTTSVTLNLPDAQARNAFEQELQRAFPGSFKSAPASEDGFTLDHALMRLNVTVADQFPGSTSGGEIDKPPLQMMRKSTGSADQAEDATELEEDSTKE